MSGRESSKNSQGGNLAVHLTHFSHSHDDDDGVVPANDIYHSKDFR